MNFGGAHQESEKMQPRDSVYPWSFSLHLYKFLSIEFVAVFSYSYLMTRVMGTWTLTLINMSEISVLFGSVNRSSRLRTLSEFMMRSVPCTVITWSKVLGLGLQLVRNFSSEECHRDICCCYYIDELVLLCSRYYYCEQMILMCFSFCCSYCFYDYHFMFCRGLGVDGNTMLMTSI